MACTCAGVAPGYPQHEAGCGRVEPADPEYDAWLAALLADPPAE